MIGTAATGDIMKLDMMKKPKKRIVVLLSFIVILMLTALPAHAEEFCPPAKPLPNLTGNYREDLISVCNSQLGYVEAESGNSIYAAWAGQAGRAWCSEFVAWCARKAGISKTIIPTGTSSKKYMEVFSGQGRLFIPEGNANNCICRNYTAKTISFTDIKRGDIIFTETDGNYSNGPDHTALVLSNEGDKLSVINGNSHNSVRITSCSKEKIHCLARPCYEKAACAASVIKTKLRIRNVRVSRRKIRVIYTGIKDKYARYQIAYRLAGSYKWITKTTAAKSIQLTKLKPGRKYIIRVRAFCKVSNNAEDTEYGSWSKTRTIKTKK